MNWSCWRFYPSCTLRPASGCSSVITCDQGNNQVHKRLSYIYLSTCYVYTCSMLLTIDVGNTNLTLGLYDGNTLFAHWRLATDHARMPDEYGLQFFGLLQNGEL